MGTRTVKGRLVFAEQVEGETKPLHNMRVELWDLDRKSNSPVACGFTDLDGSYALSYDPDCGDETWFQKPDLVVRLMDRDYHYTDDDQPEDEWELIAAFHRSSSLPAPGEEIDMGTQSVGYWEYENPKREGAVAFSPRVAVHDGEVPQPFRTGRLLEQATVAARYMPVFGAGMMSNAKDTSLPKIQPMNDAFPPNLTRELGQEAADSDDYLCQLALNGFNPALLRRGEEEGLLFQEFSWKGLAQDGIHFAPDTRANFRLKDGALSLESIVVTKRVAGAASADAAYEEPVTYTSADPAWKGVKRLFRVNYFLFGEITTHLSATHLNVEQYIVPIRRNVHRSPVARLLNPHFYGTVAVNLGANGLLIAPQGLIPQTAAVTPTSVGVIAQRSFTEYNWAGWSPRQPLCEAHRYAHLANLYWEFIGDYVSDFFKANDDEIREHWPEIHRMSQELVAHAASYEPQDASLYYDGAEINTPDKEHPERGELGPSAVSAITTSDTADAPGVANLLQVCRYLLYITTFQHSWVNDTQYDIGGEVRFATLGVSGDLTDAAVLEGPLEEQVRPYDALQHPFYTYMLTKTRYGYLMRNEDDDVPLALRQRLADRQADFKALGLDVRYIRSRINT
jgi:lipoxygenase